jgi:hypothetical protein
MRKEKSHMQTLRSTLLAVAAGLAAYASSSTSEAGRAESPAPAAPAGARAETANYVAEIAPGGTYKAGAEGTVKVTIAAKGDYHINPDYPYKFKAAAPAADGVSYPKPLLQRADGTFEHTRGAFLVPFVASKAGKATVGGTLHLGVCTANNCITDKVPLELAVEVR